MKSSVLIALLIIGAALIAIPPFFGYLHTQEIAGLLREGANRVTLERGITSEYSFACWSIGTLVIIVGIVGAFKTTEN